MKEQVKAILFDFKDAGWSVQKVEKELGFSNGSLGKPISDYRFCKLLELHQKEIKKEPTVTKELREKIAENNLPENKAKIEEERNPSNTQDFSEIKSRIAKIEEMLALPPKYMPAWKRPPLESELNQLKFKLLKNESN